MSHEEPRNWLAERRERSGERSQVFGPLRTVVDSTWDALQQLEEDGGLHHVIDVAAHLEASMDVAPVIRRCLISGSFVVIQTPSLTYVQPGPDEHLAGIKEGWRLSDRQRRVEAALLQQGIPTNKYCVVLPSRMYLNVDIEGGESVDTYMAMQQRINAEIVELERRIYTVPAAAEYALVRRLNRQDSAADSVVSGLMMPDIRNLTIEDLTRLRDDHEESFTRLRHALKRYLDGIDSFDGEQKFRHVIEEIDHECRTTEAEFKRIAKNHTRTLQGMLVTGAMVGVATATNLVEPGLGTALSAALGSVSAHGILSDRIKRASSIDELQSSDYWIAWKIHQQNAAKTTG